MEPRELTSDTTYRPGTIALTTEAAEALDQAKKVLQDWYEQTAWYKNRRVLSRTSHLSEHGKNRRIRKKNLKRFWQVWLEGVHTRKG